MPGLEAALPNDKQFEQIVVNELDYYLASPEVNIEMYKDILNPYVEFDCDVAKLWELSLKFSRLLRENDEDPMLVQATIYRSMIFGLELVEAMTTSKSGGTLALSELVTGQKDVAEAIRCEVTRYLSARPHLDELIGYYMPEIDDSGLRNHHAEIGAGVILLLSERRDGACYANKSAGALSPEDFTE